MAEYRIVCKKSSSAGATMKYYTVPHALTKKVEVGDTTVEVPNGYETIVYKTEDRDAAVKVYKELLTTTYDESKIDLVEMSNPTVTVS